MTICKRCGCWQGDGNPHNGKCEPMPPLDLSEERPMPEAVRAKKLDQLFDKLDPAAKFPGSISLNFGEISLETVNLYAELFPDQEGTPTREFDIESVLRMMEEWWREKYKD